MVLDILMKMNPLNDPSVNKDVSFHFFSFCILKGSGHNLRNTSLIDKNNIFYVCFNMISDAFYNREF